MAKGIRKSDLKEVVREVMREEITLMGEASGQDMPEILPALALGAAGSYIGSKLAQPDKKDYE